MKRISFLDDQLLGDAAPQHLFSAICPLISLNIKAPGFFSLASSNPKTFSDFSEAQIYTENLRETLGSA
ncbi:hypothetical protein CHARACLAT_009574 [Characodon lateralis]|uniref:Uncharacterized protein n=1 Tax=Characodon lateralis TaxID=208331 RepID=A0ABU7D5G4_9TELE|nr:hypothetical protein [Characodon lateralis]